MEATNVSACGPGRLGTCVTQTRSEVVGHRAACRAHAPPASGSFHLASVRCSPRVQNTYLFREKPTVWILRYYPLDFICWQLILHFLKLLRDTCTDIQFMVPTPEIFAVHSHISLNVVLKKKKKRVINRIFVGTLIYPYFMDIKISERYSQRKIFLFNNTLENYVREYFT